MSLKEALRQILWEAYEDGCRRCEADLWRFVGPLNDWVYELLQRQLPVDWRGRLGAYLDNWEPEGFEVAPDQRRILEDWIYAWARYLGLLPDTSGASNVEASQEAAVTAIDPAKTENVQGELVAERSAQPAVALASERKHPASFRLASQQVAQNNARVILQNVTTKWMLGTGASNPDTVNGLFDALTGLNAVVKVADLAKLVSLLSVDTIEQIGGLTEFGVSEIMPNGEQGKESLERLQKIIRNNLGYSWWLRVDWELRDLQTGKVTKHSTIELFQGGQRAGLFGGQFGGSASGAALESFKQRILTELRLTRTIKHQKAYTTH